MVKPRSEYIGFVQPVPAPQKDINKFNELEDLLTNGVFIQPSIQWLMTADQRSHPQPFGKHKGTVLADLPQPVRMLSSPHAHAFRQRLDSPHPDYHFLGDQLAHHENRRYRVSSADF